MAIVLTPKNEAAGAQEFPNGFWPAVMVDTPISALIEAEHTDRGTIRYEHKGYVGEVWFTKEEAEQMLAILTDYVKTDDYLNHHYFKERENQMVSFMSFLKECGGFLF